MFSTRIYPANCKTGLKMAMLYKLEVTSLRILAKDKINYTPGERCVITKVANEKESGICEISPAKVAAQQANWALFQLTSMIGQLKTMEYKMSLLSTANIAQKGHIVLSIQESMNCIINTEKTIRAVQAETRVTPIRNRRVS